MIWDLAGIFTVLLLLRWTFSPLDESDEWWG